MATSIRRSRKNKRHPSSPDVLPHEGDGGGRLRFKLHYLVMIAAIGIVVLLRNHNTLVKQQKQQLLLLQQESILPPPQQQSPQRPVASPSSAATTNKQRQIRQTQQQHFNNYKTKFNVTAAARVSAPRGNVPRPTNAYGYNPRTVTSSRNTNSDSRNTLQFYDDAPILIVGGTDGSGTRAFVDMLKQLGVIVVADDTDAYDVHASEIFNKQGWPPFVNMVLNETHSANFQWTDLSSKTQKTLESELPTFYSRTLGKYKSAKLWRQSKTNTLAVKNNNQLLKNLQVASKVSFVIKAPISMVVLPALQHAFNRPIKFLHCVRDGRDIALGKNQSPVLKFYDHMYSHDPDQHSTEEQTKLFGNVETDLISIRAIQLWNDWNLQVHNMLTTMKANDNTYSDENNFDFLTMRSEDMVSPDTRWETIRALAEFVGSPLSEHQLCCIARKDNTDFGQSVLHQKGHNDYVNDKNWNPAKKGRHVITSKDATNRHKKDDGQVKKRYGKWQQLLADQPKLSEFLHQEGKDALGVFGYEPVQAFSYDVAETASGQPFQCPQDFQCEQK